MSLFDRRQYTSSEFPGISRGKGMGRISRSASSTSALNRAKISDSIRNHRAGAASSSVTVGKARHPRRRLLGNINQRLLVRVLTVLAAAAVVGIGVMLIVTAANSGGRQLMSDGGSLDSLDGDVITADDTGSTVTIALGGSIKLQPEIISAAASGEGYDFNSYLSELRLIMDADVSIASVSATVDGKGGNELINGYPAPNYPSQLPEALSRIGVNCVPCASGYVMKSGFDGLVRTADNYAAAGIAPVGVCTSPSGSRYVIKKVNSISIGIAAYNCVTESELSSMKNSQTDSGFTQEQLGWCVNQLDITKASSSIIPDVDAMRAAGAQFVIVCLNWGSSDLTSPNYDMRSLAQDMIDHGVDVTLGYGSDAMQKITVKKYTGSDGVTKNCYVFYSLGNLFSDPGADAPQSLRESMVINLTLQRAAGSESVSVAKAYYHPVYINRDETYAEQNTYLKYHVVPAARYVDASTLPQDVFSTEAQLDKCVQTFTDIRRKFQEDWGMSEYFVLGTVEKIESSAESGGSDAHL